MTDDSRVLDGRYRLAGRLGAGGMGTVHRAHDLQLDRDVAVKLLRAADDPVQRARLRAEARFAGGFQHPGIVRVYDYGEERTDAGTTPYVVMQLVDGTPLSQRLRDSGPVPPEEVANLLAGTAEALAVAHAAGVVHRDLKPSNIVVTPAGRPVLVDFGVARSDAADPLTETGLVVGTADYLSPEQVEGHRATPASDVYALGVLAHHCLTGTSPFHRESQIATALAHLRDTAADLPDGVPVDLRTLVLSMLARDPADRPTAAEVAARAVRAPASRPVVLPPLPVGPPAPPQVVSTWTRRRIAVVAAVSSALLLASLAAVAFGHDAAAPPAAAAGAAGAAGADHKRHPAHRIAVRTTPSPSPSPTPARAAAPAARAPATDPRPPQGPAAGHHHRPAPPPHAKPPGHAKPTKPDKHDSHGKHGKPPKHGPHRH